MDLAYAESNGGGHNRRRMCKASSGGRRDKMSKKNTVSVANCNGKGKGELTDPMDCSDVNKAGLVVDQLAFLIIQGIQLRVVDCVV